MTAQVIVVDYGCGNLLSVSRALAHCGADVTLSDDPRRIESADRLVLPGVGAFAAATKTLHGLGLFDALKTFAAKGRPFLGICLGMQMMMTASEEFGLTQGLGFISGNVERIPGTDAAGAPHQVPHIGWNTLRTVQTGWEGSPLAEHDPAATVYFVHSYHAVPVDDADILAVCDYNGRQLTAAIARDNLCGVQFHPEKSGPAGLNILSTWLEQGA